MSERYQTGYKKPPKSGQFKKGRSGNPKGRPKKLEESFVDNLMNELAQKMNISENGQNIKITKEQAIIKHILAGSFKGQASYTKILIHLIDKYHIPAQKQKKLNKKIRDTDFEKITDPIQAAKAYKQFIDDLNEEYKNRQ